MTPVIGIDPGLTGGITVLSTTGELERLNDLPVIRDRAVLDRRRLSEEPLDSPLTGRPARTVPYCCHRKSWPYTKRDGWSVIPDAERADARKSACGARFLDECFRAVYARVRARRRSHLRWCQPSAPYDAVKPVRHRPMWRMTCTSRTARSGPKSHELSACIAGTSRQHRYRRPCTCRISGPLAAQQSANLPNG